MKKFKQLALLVGFVAGAGLLSAPFTVAQDASSSTDNRMPESTNIAQSPPHAPDFPGMMGGAMHGEASLASGADDLMAMGPSGEMMMHGMGRMTDDQLEKMHAIKSDFQDKVGLKMVELHSNERALHDLLTQAEFDKSKAMSVQAKINTLHDELANMKLEEHIGLINCLSAEQRKELRRMYLRHADFGGMMMHHKMHGGHEWHHPGGPEGWHEGEHHEHHEGPAGGDKS